MTFNSHERKRQSPSSSSDTAKGRTVSTDQPKRRQLWKGNLLFSGFMIAIIMIYSFWQVQYAKRKFIEHTLEDVQLLARVIDLNARNAVLSRSVIEDVLEIFLSNTGNFIRYLNSIEPLSDSELTNLAVENGLYGIRIVTGSKSYIEGPPGWLKDIDCPCNVCVHKKSQVLKHIPEKYMYLVTVPGYQSYECVIVGLSAGKIEEMANQLGLMHLLNNLSGLAGISYATLESNYTKNIFDSSSRVVLLEFGDRKIAQTRITLNDQNIVLGLDAESLFENIRHVWQGFLFFSIIVTFVGMLLSWISYHYQCMHLEHVKALERRLAAEREDAVIGRASAVIAHEIRNPLNAVSMGLQRLKLEADALKYEHGELVDCILHSIQRTNVIVSNLQRYAGPIVPKMETVYWKEIISGILQLYSQAIEKHAIVIRTEQTSFPVLVGDRNLLEHAFENIVKNAIEAQTQGGYIAIQCHTSDKSVTIEIENAGFHFSEEHTQDIISPYFTTKTNGSGLGLSIAKRIVLSHDGTFSLSVPKQGCLRTTITFPLRS